MQQTNLPQLFRPIGRPAGFPPLTSQVPQFKNASIEEVVTSLVERSQTQELRLQNLEVKLSFGAATSARSASPDPTQSGSSAAALQFGQAALQIPSIFGQEELQATEKLQKLEERLNFVSRAVKEWCSTLVEQVDQHFASLPTSQASADQDPKIEGCVGDLGTFKDKIEELSLFKDKINELSLRTTAVETWQKDFKEFSPTASRPSSTPQEYHSSKVISEANNHEYRLMPSVWDLFLVIGTHELRLGTTVHAITLFTLNFSVQLCFMLVCYFNFRVPDIDRSTVAAARHFRLSVSHEAKYLDPSTKSSLAERLCSSRFDESAPLSMEIATAQSDVLSMITDFLALEESTFARLFHGQLMCILALACWTITILTELRKILDFACAISNLPREEGLTHTTIDVIKGSGSSLHFTNMSLHRKISALFMASFRAVVALFLLASGCAWLATTVVVRDLLLNAVALEFILNIDEIVFEALVPQRARTLMECFEPLKVDSPFKYKSVDLRIAAFMVAIPGLMVYFYCSYTQVMMKDMQDVEWELCHEPLDFTYDSDAFSQILIGKTIKDEDGLGHATHAAVQEVLQHQAGQPTFTSSGLARSYNPTIWRMTVKRAAAISPDRLVDLYNPTCIDLLGTSDTGPLKLYADRFPDIKTCTESMSLCYGLEQDDIGRFMRTMCPETCGCSNPQSQLPIVSAIYGCPETTCKESATWLAARQEAYCLDMNVSQLRASKNWTRWVQHVNETESVWLQLGPAMAKYGCDFESHLSYSPEVRKSIRQQLCTGRMSNYLKPIAVTCPEVCGCYQDDTSSCQEGPTNRWCECVAHLDLILKGDETHIPVGPCMSVLCDNRASLNEGSEPYLPYLGTKYKDILGKKSIFKCGPHPR